MNDRAELRTGCNALAERLQGPPLWPQLKAVYMDGATLVGQINGAVNEAARFHGDRAEIRGAQAALQELKVGMRQVGFDIRLASEPALQIGLQTALAHAREVLDWLDRLPA